MLFDLRGRGRKNTIKVIYLSLALLMGGGLVLFGIGGDVSGGLFDAFREQGTGDTGEERFLEQEREAVAATRRNPQDAAAWGELARVRVQLAQFGDRFDLNTEQYTEEGKRELREAVAAYERFLELDPPMDDETSRIASRMVGAYAALGDLKSAARAQGIVAEVRESVGTYSQSAILYYQAGNNRLGDLAADKALALADKDEREALKGQFESAKQQGIANQVAPPPEG